MNHTLANAMLVAATVLSSCASSADRPTSDDCPVCHKPVGDGPEVRVVRFGEAEPGTRYRCFVCPIVEGKTGKSWTMRAASGVDGRWVTFHMDGDRVVTDPPTAVVLALQVEAGAECLDVHRVFTDEDEFRRYVESHPAVKEAKARRLEDVLAEHKR